MGLFYKYIKGEEIIVKIKTKRDIGFWKYQLFGILSLFMKDENDYLIITDKRILFFVKDKVKANHIYQDFSKIKINTKSDLLSFQNENKELQEISLSEFQLEYEDYQYLKHKLN
ncbi:hypothetical protein [Polaribacter sp. KT 15]|uniref:hypothetical protein n=1 Tax=Polaribacter sp. KT 15 TaxID=1896175 RepID=UPI00090B3BE0|nr:hypothetical protein [Polaribacter sp. KT 15]SHM76982.1 hypothetical protein SAMN05720268_0453 [Polaribacter sp. KT 15]